MPNKTEELESHVQVTFDLGDFEALGLDCRLMATHLRDMYDSMIRNLQRRLIYRAKQFSDRAVDPDEYKKVLKEWDHPYARRHGVLMRVPAPTIGHIALWSGELYRGWRTSTQRTADARGIILYNDSLHGKWVLGGTDRMLPRPTLRYIAMSMADEVEENLVQESAKSFFPIWGSNVRRRKSLPHTLPAVAAPYGVPAALRRSRA